MANKKNIFSRLLPRVTKEYLPEGFLGVNDDDYKLILNYIKDGVIVMDVKGLIMNANIAALTKLGVTLDEILGKSFFESIQLVNETGALVEKQNSPLTLSLNLKKKIILTYRYVRKNGSNFPASIVTIPLIEKSDIKGVVQIFTDLTREKEVDDMRNEFIGLASHQLKTPLSSIKWYAEILKDDKNITEDQKHYVEYITRSNERMISIVRTFIDCSWMESGSALEESSIDIKSFVQDIVFDFDLVVKGKNQTLNVNIDPMLTTMKTDKNLLMELLSNLLSNAIKYSPNESPINLNMHKSKDNIVIEVKDSGYGIPISEQKKIFKRFYRGTNILIHDTDGSGLGLYLCKMIVNKLGGRIWFESQENKGTMFAIELPLS